MSRRQDDRVGIDARNVATTIPPSSTGTGTTCSPAAGRPDRRRAGRDPPPRSAAPRRRQALSDEPDRLGEAIADDNPLGVGRGPTDPVQVDRKGFAELGCTPMVEIGQSLARRLVEHPTEGPQPDLARELRDVGSAVGEVDRISRPAGAAATGAASRTSPRPVSSHRADSQIALGDELLIGLHNDATRHSSCSARPRSTAGDRPAKPTVTDRARSSCSSWRWSGWRRPDAARRGVRSANWSSFSASERTLSDDQYWRHDDPNKINKPQTPMKGVTEMELIFDRDCAVRQPRRPRDAGRDMGSDSRDEIGDDWAR